LVVERSAFTSIFSVHDRKEPLMIRFRLFRLAATAALAWFGCSAGAHAQRLTFNAATDWLATFPTTASVGAAHSATWGGGSAWSGGELSYNWTNQPAATGNSSLQLIPTFYSPSTGYLTSGANGATKEATYSYTVPFQAYQFNPGATIHQMVGETLTQQIAYAQDPIGGSHAITLPANMVSGGAASGYVQEVSAVKAFASATSVIGFSTTAFNPSGGTFNDGTGSVQDSGTGVWYNYGANATSTSLGALNAPSGAGDSNGTNTYNTLTLGGTWGPSYVAWTAPASGTISINMQIWDTGQRPSDGNPSFFVFANGGLGAGPAAPILSASRWTVPTGSPSGTLYTGTNFNAAPSTTIAGSTIAQIANLSGYTTSASNPGLSWVSGQFTVSAGEVIYFAIDPNHDYGQGSGLGARAEGNQDPIALSAVVSFVPEPSSIALLAWAGVGLALAAWRRRRSPC
jgi:hypothetical protein